MKPHEIKMFEGVAYEFWPEFKCPVCNNGLLITANGASGESNPLNLFCAVGRCRSAAACDGATGPDVDTAIAKIEAAHELELIAEERERLEEESEFDHDDFIRRMSDSAWRAIMSGYELRN